MNLFQRGSFVLHSSSLSDWKIDCDALTDDDIETLAELIAGRVRFNRCEWVETGGARLGRALQGYVSANATTLLIVDDVLTTGASMEEQRAGREAMGVVIFARGCCPDWVQPIFTVWPAIGTGYYECGCDETLVPSCSVCGDNGGYYVQSTRGPLETDWLSCPACQQEKAELVT